jgi:hypothetical protein
LSNPCDRRGLAAASKNGYTSQASIDVENIPQAMPIHLESPPKKVSDMLSEAVYVIPAEGMTLSQLLAALGEQGLLVFCIFLTVPFLLPIQIPGLSSVFGLLIAMIALGVVLNRVPRLPRWLMRRHISASLLTMILEQGAQLSARFERLVYPRWFSLTRNAAMHRVTGILLLLAAGLLTLPLIIPFSNILPAIAIVLLTVGIVQRDGLSIVCGYAVTIGTAVYFVVVTLVAVHGLHVVLGARLF